MSSTKKNQKGYSLVELVIYIALFALISVVIVNSLVTVMRTYASAQAYRRLQINGELIVERVVREVRDASSLSGSSVYGANPSTVVLVSTDTGGVDHTMVFSVVNNTLTLTDNGTASPLSTAEVSVTNFVARHITTSSGEGVKIELTLTTSNGHVISAPFYATVMLR